MALSASRGVSLCWGQEQAGVAGVSGHLCHPENCGPGEQRAQEKNIQELQGSSCKSLQQVFSNNGGCAVAIPGRAVGLGLCSNSLSGNEIAGGRREIGMHWSPVQHNAGHSRGKGRPRDTLGRAGGCKSPQTGNKQIAVQHSDL